MHFTIILCALYSFICCFLGTQVIPSVDLFVSSKHCFFYSVPVLAIASTNSLTLTLTLIHALQVEGAVWEPLEANPTLHPRSFFSQPTALLTLLDQDRNNAPYLVYVGDNWVFGPPHGLTEVRSSLIFVQSHIYICSILNSHLLLCPLS